MNYLQTVRKYDITCKYITFYIPLIFYNICKTNLNPFCIFNVKLQLFDQFN